MINVENLEKKFGDLVVLKNVNANIEKGEVISIIGPSGTGKSTFLRCLNLLETPTNGRIFVDGIDILDKNSNIPKIRQKMGMVFQSFNLFHHLSVLENLTIGPINLLKKNPKEAEKNALRLLKIVGLAEKANSFDDELSGGQKQRVAIARCLSMDPEIILFDEPTSSLDPTMVSEVLSVIRRLAQDGMTMIIVTHEMDFARDVSDRVFYMDEGIIYEEGSSDQIFENPQKDKTNAFINQIRNLHYHINSPDYDLYALNAKVNTFLEKHFFPNNKIDKVILLLEELMELYKSKFEKIEANIILAYSEKKSETEISFSYSGDKNNILESDDIEDTIPITLITNISKEIHYKYSDVNQLKLIFK